MAWWRVVWIELRTEARLAHWTSFEGTLRPRPNLLRCHIRFTEPSHVSTSGGNVSSWPKPQLKQGALTSSGGWPQTFSRCGKWGILREWNSEPPCVNTYAQAFTTPLNNRGYSLEWEAVTSIFKLFGDVELVCVTQCVCDMLPHCTYCIQRNISVSILSFVVIRIGLVFQVDSKIPDDPVRICVRVKSNQSFHLHSLTLSLQWEENQT